VKITVSREKHRLPAWFGHAAARRSTVRTGYLVYLAGPQLELGEQLLTANVPPPNAVAFQLVQVSRPCQAPSALAEQ
jgi:hypothetical protein